MTPKTVGMKMQRQAIDEQLTKLRERYARRNREGRSRRLDELCEPYGYSRKHALKRLRDPLPETGPTSPPGPAPRYEPVREVIAPV